MQNTTTHDEYDVQVELDQNVTRMLESFQGRKRSNRVQSESSSNKRMRAEVNEKEKSQDESETELDRPFV